MDISSRRELLAIYPEIDIALELKPTRTCNLSDSKKRPDGQYRKITKNKRWQRS